MIIIYLKYENLNKPILKLNAERTPQNQNI